MTLTVLTPTYNRVHTLHRVYESLCSQAIKGFEWFVLDDGSTDGTRELVESWKTSSPFSISYEYKNNGGKHTAINIAMKKITSEFTLILDSDDECEPWAIGTFIEMWKDLEKEKSRFAAVASLCRDENGDVIGSKFPKDIFDSDHLSSYFIYKIKGDKWECWRTEVLKEFPFPEHEGVRVLPESVVLNKIARKYKTRYINKTLRIYHNDGVDSSLVRTKDPRKNSPGARIRELENLNANMDFFTSAPLELFFSAVKYVRACIHLGKDFGHQGADLKGFGVRLLWLTALIPGSLIALFESRGTKNLSGKSWIVQ